jgi:hypothetical protein
MKYRTFLLILLISLTITSSPYLQEKQSEQLTLNTKAEGYQGIWYMNTRLDNEYRYKYSGGLATYTAKHRPFAIYCEEVNKTFFCYGGTSTKDISEDHKANSLLMMVSYFDHQSGKVPRPTILLDKETGDAHDNPVISIDSAGHIWIFSTSHGTSRKSYIHKSKKSYDINDFDQIHASKVENESDVPFDNFSYMQPWFIQNQGFFAFFTKYKLLTDRTPSFITSKDGKIWSKTNTIAAIDLGHYQVSGVFKNKAATAFNFHPKVVGKKLHGLNWRTNLYYIETSDMGNTWQTASGKNVVLPITEINNPALVFDYQSEGLLVYLKDIRFDKVGNPILLFITSKGYASGPQNNPRTWRTAYWTGTNWEINKTMTSDNNYDMGTLYIESDGTWRIIAPTETGSQPYNTGGEIAMWISKDNGKKWHMKKQLTSASKYNHTYARQPVNAFPDFYAFWADGHGREPSECSLYFCDIDGNVFKLPRKMEQSFVTPELIKF